MRKNISTHTPSEKRVGYSRAVIVDKTIWVSGTTSVDEDGKTVGKTLGEQTRFIVKKIKRVLEGEKFSLSDVVLVRAYLVSMNELSEFDRVFHEFFSKIKPACTVVGTQSLVNPTLHIELEFVAQKN